MAVGTYALTTLATLKSWLSITDSASDALLESAIDRATALIEAVCDRELKARTHYEWAMPRGERSLVVRHSPIVSVDLVAYGRTPAMAITSDTSATDVVATVGFDGSILRLYKVAADGTTSTASLSVSTYATTSALVSEIQSAVSGWSATLTQNAYARSLYRVGGRSAVSAAVTLNYPIDSAAEYEVDHSSGTIHVTVDRFPVSMGDLNRFPSGFFPVFVQYAGGYATIPADLEQVAIDVAADLYRERLVDKSVNSEALGDYNYSRRAAEELLGVYVGRLAPYREIR